MDFEQGRKYYENFLSGENWEKIQAYQFEFYISTLNNNVPVVEHISEIFRSGTPNMTHFCFAYLVKANYVRDIITTNFDTKIEDAYRVLTQGRDNVLSLYHEKDFTDDSLLRDEPKIIKIHGCCSDPASIRTTLEAVVQKQLADARSPIIQNVFGASSKDVIVFGYSFSDEFDVNNIIRTIEDIKPKRIFHIKHNRKDDSKEIRNLDPLFSNYDGYKIVVNTQTIIKELNDQFGFNYEHLIDDSGTSKWNNILSNWIGPSGNGLRLFVAGSILYDIQSWDDAITLYEASSKAYLDDDDYRGNGLAIGQIAIIRKHQGRYSDALVLFEKIIKLYEGIDKPILMARAMHQKAMIAQLDRDFKLAFELFHEILEICKDKSPFDYSNALGEIGSIYIELSEFDKALEIIEQAYEFNEKTGHVTGMAANLQDIGLIYQKQGKNGLSKEKLMQSISIYKRLGNIRSVASVSQNLGVLEQNVDLDNALKLFNLAWKLQAGLDDIPGMIRTEYHIGLVNVRKGDLLEAMKWTTQSLEHSDSISDKHGKAYALALLAHINSLNGNSKEAIRLNTEAMSLFIECKDKYGYKHSQKMMAVYLNA